MLLQTNYIHIIETHQMKREIMNHLVMKKNNQMIMFNYQALNAPPNAPLAAIGSKDSIPPGAAAPGIGVTWF